MTIHLFAFLDDAKSSILQFVNNCLLVAGAFLVGYVLGGVIGWAFGKYVFKQKSTDTIKQLGRPIGGIILALIVAILVFSGMGKRFGEGGDGKGTPSDSGDRDTKTKAEPVTVDPKVIPPKIDVKPADVYYRITILEGNDVPAKGQFYRLEDGQTKTLEELKPLILAFKGKETKRMALAIHFKSNTPPGDPRLVTNLTHWATEEAGLDVTFPASK